MYKTGHCHQRPPTLWLLKPRLQILNTSACAEGRASMPPWPEKISRRLTSADTQQVFTYGAHARSLVPAHGCTTLNSSPSSQPGICIPTGTPPIMPIGLTLQSHVKLVISCNIASSWKPKVSQSIPKPSSFPFGEVDLCLLHVVNLLKEKLSSKVIQQTGHSFYLSTRLIDSICNFQGSASTASIDSNSKPTHRTPCRFQIEFQNQNM